MAVLVGQLEKLLKIPRLHCLVGFLQIGQQRSQSLPQGTSLLLQDAQPRILQQQAGGGYSFFSLLAGDFLPAGGTVRLYFLPMESDRAVTEHHQLCRQGTGQGKAAVKIAPDIHLLAGIDGTGVAEIALPMGFLYAAQAVLPQEMADLSLTKIPEPRVLLPLAR